MTADPELIAAARDLIAAARAVLDSGVLSPPPSRPCPHGTSRADRPCPICDLIESGAYG